MSSYITLALQFDNYETSRKKAFNFPSWWVEVFKYPLESKRTGSRQTIRPVKWIQMHDASRALLR